jgi:anti-sigma factor RsiW
VTCQELVELVSDYLEGRLAAADADRFEAHLALCDGCRAYVELMRGTLRELGHLELPDSLSLEAEDRLLRAFRDWRGHS